YVVDGIAAAAANTKHGDAWLQLGDVRRLQIDSHCLRPLPFPPPRRCGRLWGCPRQLKTVSQPLTHAMQFSARSGHPETGKSFRRMAIEARHLRIDQKSDRRRER